MSARLADAEVGSLLVQFAKDIQYDAHLLETRVSRSSAAKELRAHARQTLPVLLFFLENLAYTESAPYMEDVRVATTMLIADMGHELKLNVPQDLKFGDSVGWIAWGKTQCEAILNSANHRAKE